jgi:hypothetical protein
MTEEEFDQRRASALAIAYRMLGSVSEAEDLVQERSPPCLSAHAQGAGCSSTRSAPGTRPGFPAQFMRARTHGGRVATLRAEITCAR